jgi:2-polyprenyl-3-methyl-5-hydroxy-6-metoxy-1,4-benzoquinol methylase
MLTATSSISRVSPAVDLYRRVSLADWTHVGVRWRTSPLGQLAAFVPPEGRILEVGCGRGLLCAHLALGSGAREVVGIDVDRDKLAVAQKIQPEARRSGARLDFHAVAPGELPEGSWDAILIVDVLYLMPLSAQRRLLADCAAALARGGILLVKEMAQTPRWKFRWNYVQETLAVQCLRLTQGSDRMVFASPEALGSWLTAAGLLVEQRPMSRGYVHAHHLVLGRRPHEGPQG